jgi:signal transduction histidine kinase
MPYQGRDVRVVAIRDLTWRKAMEEEKARLQKENLTFSLDTLGFVTHELKSPLAAMQSLIALMMEGYVGEVPEKIGTYLLRIRRNCEELHDMVKNYLDISRIGLGELVAHKVPVNYYSEIVEPCVEHAQILFESREVTLTVDCPENVTVQADHELLRIALTNYLTNAAKYGATHTQVRLTVREEQGIITTTVWNEGTGFRPEEQASLFAKFSRLENKNTLKNRGSGLGLYLTKHIIELHHGKVWAESVPEQWAKFCFSFPLNASKKTKAGKS